MHKFKAELEIIRGNPFVFVPEAILKDIFKQAGKDKGPIPIRGKINGVDYTQTLVKYVEEWRLYVNTSMFKNSPKRVGEMVELTIEFDPSDRSIEPHPRLMEALEKNQEAKKVFVGLSPSLQKEIVRYISFLKTEESVERNVTRAINFLLGKGSFVGRNRPD